MLRIKADSSTEMNTPWHSQPILVTPEQFSKIKDAEFVDLIIECDDASDKIRLYPIKTIEKLF